jgi:hypothetical protein
MAPQLALVANDGQRVTCVLPHVPERLDRKREEARVPRKVGPVLAMLGVLRALRRKPTRGCAMPVERQ